MQERRSIHIEIAYTSVGVKLEATHKESMYILTIALILIVTASIHMKVIEYPSSRSIFVHRISISKRRNTANILIVQV